MDFKNAVAVMVNQIVEIVSQMIDQAKFDKSYTAVVIDKEQENNSSFYIYTIMINGMEKTVKSKFNYNVNDYVFVIVPQNNWNNAKIVQT